MAKTLIGNIKGKDGRGISKIEKTATNGVVDTYTISYTDGTTSTYDVKNADNVAIQRQIVPSAAVESSTTASQAYAAGDYVVVNGVLRKVTASIMKGSTIGATNSTATTVTGENKTVLNSISRIEAFMNRFEFNNIEKIRFYKHDNGNFELHTIKDGEDCCIFWSVNGGGAFSLTEDRGVVFANRS